MSPFTSRHQVIRSTETRASSYDQFAAFLYASVAVVGFLVLMMFLIWLLMARHEIPNTIIPDMTSMGNNNRPEGIAEDWQPPGVEEFPEVEQPQLADALEKMTDAVSSVKAQLEKVDGEAPEMGRGPGLGDNRQTGPGDGTGDVIPDSERLEIVYSAGSMQEYMTILNSFGIELAGVSMNSDQIHYVTDIVSGSPSFVVDVRGKEKRLGFRNKPGRLRGWDFNKLGQAQIPTAQKYAVQYYPEATRQILLSLESQEYLAEGLTIADVLKTTFNVRAGGASGFEYFVVKIAYR